MIPAHIEHKAAGRRWTRAALSAFIAAPLLLLTALPSSAAPAIPHGTTYSITLAAGDPCPFAVRLDIRDGQRSLTTGTGLTLIAGPLAVTATNLATGTRRTYNISGPLVGSARVGLWMLAQPKESGNPFLIVTAGQPSFHADGTLASLHGTVLHDVCAELR